MCRWVNHSSNGFNSDKTPTRQGFYTIQGMIIPAMPMNPSQKAYNSQFAKVKKEVFDRDKWQCFFQQEHRCEGMLDVHHIIPRSLQGDNELKNLITLCRKYHNHIHDKMSFENRIEKCREALRQRYGYTYNRGVNNLT